MTSPGAIISSARRMCRLSPARVQTVNALPATRPDGHTAWMRESIAPIRSIASPTFAAGSAPRRATREAAARGNARAGAVVSGGIGVAPPSHAARHAKATAPAIRVRWGALERPTARGLLDELVAL